MRNGLHRTVICSLLLIGTLWASKVIDFQQPMHLEKPLVTIPTRIEGWVGVEDPPIEDDIAEQLKASDYILRTYHQGKDTLGLFLAYYSQQRAGENIHPPKQCLPGNGWNIVQQGITAVPVLGRTVEINAYHIRRGEDRRVVFYWYQSRTWIVASEYTAKFLLIRGALYGEGTSGSLARVTVQDSPGASAIAVRFMSAVIPEIQRCLAPGGIQ